MMKKMIFSFLNIFFGKKQFYRFFLVLRNIGIQGLNHRNTDIKNNGELFLIKAVSKFYNKNENQLVLFDVGANIGNYSKILAEAFHPSARIVAFEPFPEAFMQLKTVTESFPQIQAIQLGLSDKEASLILHTSSEYSEVGGVYNRTNVLDGVKLDNQILSQFTTLDNFCAQNKIEHIHFLKIDVEGHEWNVLKGADFLLTNDKIDIIQFEYGVGNHFSRTYFIDFFELLEPQYNFYRLLKNGLVKIEAYNSDLETMILTNFVAINKRMPANFIQ
jgi:FkbM family methyltransferase